jgi:hypothetical protein
MSEIEKIKEIYNSNIIHPSTNNICGVVTKDNKAYKCPPNKYCNYDINGVGICENVNCYQYNNKYIQNMDINKFDGNDVSRNDVRNFCKRSISTDGKCGLDNNNTKCPDGQCCSINGTCGYDKESCISIAPFKTKSLNAIINRDLYSNYSDVQKFQTDFLVNNVAKKYVGNNNFEISTDGRCGIDLMNEKIIKCPDNECCTQQGYCTKDYNNCNSYNLFDFKDELKDLSSNFMHGNKFNEGYNKWMSDKIDDNFKNNNVVYSDRYCGYDILMKKNAKCKDSNCCINKKCEIGEKCKIADPNNKFHGDKFIINSLDCSDNQLLDNLKTYYNKVWKNEYKIVDILQINKVDNYTCDVKYNFEGKTSGQDSRRFTIQYKPDVGYVFTNMGDHMSGLTTLPLDSKDSLSIDSIAGIIIGCVIFVALIIYFLFRYKKKLPKKLNNLQNKLKLVKNINLLKSKPKNTYI